MATTLPDLPAMASTTAACRSRSMVSVAGGPSRGALRSASVTSTPRLFTTMRRSPSRPISSLLYWSSTPAWPTMLPASSLSKPPDSSWRSEISPTYPSEWASPTPSGYERSGTTSTLASGSSMRRASMVATSSSLASALTTTVRNRGPCVLRRSRTSAGSNEMSRESLSRAPPSPSLRSEVTTTLKDDRFSARIRPLRSKRGPRGAGMGRARMRLFSARFWKYLPRMTCSCQK